jgi:FkbM family methyltransferase
MNLKDLFKRKKLAGDQAVIKELWREIFENKLYDFEASTSAPVILDVGANIGIATLFFKSKYLQSRIKAFEPVPESFADLKTNTATLDGIELFNFGLSDFDGDGVIYGESDTAIQSMTKIFSETNKFSAEDLTPIPVKLRKLSTFISGPIDFLKIDIEGSEGKVFRELDRSGKLKAIKELVMEYHYSSFHSSRFK